MGRNVMGWMENELKETERDGKLRGGSREEEIQWEQTGGSGAVRIRTRRDGMGRLGRGGAGWNRTVRDGT